MEHYSSWMTTTTTKKRKREKTATMTFDETDRIEQNGVFIINHTQEDD